MLSFLRSMSVAEMFTTLAAWLGLLLGLFNTWQARRLSTVRISVKMQVITRDPAGDPCLLVPEMFSKPEIIPAEIARYLKAQVGLALQIINESMFPVYISSCGLCQKEGPYAQRVAAVAPLLAFGAKRSKSFCPGTPIVLPFLLNSKETVVLELRDFEMREDNLQQLLAINCCRGYAQTADGVFATKNCRTLIERLRTIVAK
ncbi:hypothetical protein [Pyramidobacter piscolens]|uniref:hypothetical protein n=1 Tax=Pyramidobacter piscolens TaxID=638849 RepID=UPI001FCC0A59|nr:hypothetical protein [Pyramidobacter piscolens]